MASDTLPLGSWEADRASMQAAGVPDRGDVSDLPDMVQFTVHVARLIRKRELNDSAEFDQPAAFVLVTSTQYQTLKKERKEERLIHTGGRRLSGRIHFVTSVATSSVIEEICGDDSALFERLRAIDVDHFPTLLYVPQRPVSSLSYYPKGTYTDDYLTEISLDTSQVTADLIDSTITTVYEHELVTPDNTGPSKIWSDASLGRPSKVAERRVQQLVRIGLAVRFAPGCSIREEQAGKEGTTDLEIVDDRTGQSGQVTHHALLEMKVLRSQGETGSPVSEGDTKKHIEEGLNQASVYGLKKNTKLKMLCCFDMRDTDFGDEKTFSHVVLKANELAVYLRRWFLYRDSKSYRAARATLAGRTSS